MGKERRQFGRRALSTTILFKAVTAANQQFRSGQMRDLSDGGVSFDTDSPPAEGDMVDLFFKTHANAADTRVRGRVAWTRPLGDVTAVGVSFAS